jgi:hypothetical protein
MRFFRSLLLVTCLESKVYAVDYSKDPEVYLKQMDFKNGIINGVADSLVTENDGVKERIEKAFRYVGEHMIYIVEVGEDIKTPIRTYNEGGGDCEDLSLLLIALLDRMGVWSYMLYGQQHVAVLAGPLNEEELRYFIPENSNGSVTAFNLTANDPSLYVFLEATGGRYSYPGRANLDIIDTALVVQPKSGYFVGMYGEKRFPIKMKKGGMYAWDEEFVLIKKEIN